MTITATVGSRQGINALKNGIQIGGTTIYAGDGTPAATYVALRIGDLYIDYTNALLYIATATGSGSWAALDGTSFAQTISAVKTFTAPPVIRGSLGGTSTPYFYKIATYGYGSSVIDWWVGTTTQWSVSGSGTVGPTPSHYGDVLISATTGKMYIAGGVSASTDWKLVTSA